jgi:hypothetical protein
METVIFFLALVVSIISVGVEVHIGAYGFAAIMALAAICASIIWSAKQ